MVCRTMELPDGSFAIVCNRGRIAPRCVVCQRTRDIKLCDYPLHGEKAGTTCDRPVCALHAHHVEPDTDYCPSHARVLAAEGKGA